MMTTIARFTPRPADDTNTTCDLILGKVLNQSKMIKPNHVYEIIDCLGQLMIKDLGESSMGMVPRDSMLSNVGWAQECGDIVNDGSHLYTKRDAEKFIEQRKTN